MKTAFAENTFLTEREQKISQLVLQLALHAEVDASLLKTLEFGDDQTKHLKQVISGYQRELSNQSPTLSSLLANATKSKCCT